MSRCFPYPPPGCALRRASKDALIESIKFQNERVNSIGLKDKSKQQKKEKRDKQREKKDKTHQNTGKSLIVQTHVGEKHWLGTKAELPSKKSTVESEHLERSSVTEEHGVPAVLVVPSTSSDSTENNNNKRKRPSSPVDVNRGHGRVIRLKIPLKKSKIEQPSFSSQEEVPCSSGRDVRDQICPQPIEAAKILKPLMNEAVLTAKIPKPLVKEAVLTPMQRAELQYTNLMNSVTVPQPLDDADDLDWLFKGKSRDLDWLFKGKSRESCVDKKLASGSDGITCSLNWGLWPRAQYLQEVDVFALPFTVPF